MKGITVDMTGIVFFLLLTGVVSMVGSFCITERLSPSELNKITELSKDELGRIIDGALADAKSKVEESIEAQIDASSEQVERALEKETKLISLLKKVRQALSGVKLFVTINLLLPTFFLFEVTYLDLLQINCIIYPSLFCLKFNSKIFLFLLFYLSLFLLSMDG